MSTLKKSVYISCATSLEMNDIVCAIDRYPTFISWCKHGIIHSHAPNKIVANLQGSKLGMAFAVQVIYLIQQNRIQVKLPSGGPFRQFDAIWHFSEERDGSTLSLELNIEYSSVWLSWTLNPIIKYEVGNLLNDFRLQAEKVYKQ